MTDSSEFDNPVFVNDVVGYLQNNTVKEYLVYADYVKVMMEDIKDDVIHLKKHAFTNTGYFDVKRYFNYIESKLAALDIYANQHLYTDTHYSGKVKIIHRKVVGVVSNTRHQLDELRRTLLVLSRPTYKRIQLDIWTNGKLAVSKLVQRKEGVSPTVVKDQLTDMIEKAGFKPQQYYHGYRSPILPQLKSGEYLSQIGQRTKYRALAHVQFVLRSKALQNVNEVIDQLNQY